VILALDVSRSMQANDVKPNRMEAARSAALTFVQNQPKSVYIGIVSFSNNAALVQSPTTNREDVRAAINRLTTQSATAIRPGHYNLVECIAEQSGRRGSTSLSDSLDSLSQLNRRQNHRQTHSLRQ